MECGKPPTGPNGPAQTDPDPDRAAHCAQAAPVPDMAALQIQALHRMVMASAELGETLQRLAIYRAEQEMKGNPVPAASRSDPGMVYTHVVRCMRHCAALANRLKRESVDGVAPEPPRATGRRKPPTQPTPQAPLEPKEAAAKEVLDDLVPGILEDDDVPDEAGLIGEICDLHEDPEVYDALAELPREDIISLIFSKLKFPWDVYQEGEEPVMQPRITAETAAALVAAALTRVRQAAATAAPPAEPVDPEFFRTEKQHILSTASAAILTDPRPAAYFLRRNKLWRLQSWLARAIMRNRIGREPSADIIRDLLQGLGLGPEPEAAEAGAPETSGGHDPP